MIRVRLTTIADRGNFEIVDENITVKEYLEGKGANLASCFTLNGRMLNGGEINASFAEFMLAGIFADEVTVYETAKTNGAR